MSEEEEMDTSDTPWFWYYLADCGRWHRFEEDPNNPIRSEDVENYFQRDPTGILNASLSGCQSKIDFKEMLQTDVSTGRQRRVRRDHNIERSGCACFSVYPVFWEMVDPSRPYQLIPLNEHTPEYKCVASYTQKDGLLDRCIVSISRIQNLDLWEIYCRKKIQLMRIQGVKEIQERRLFHGTTFGNIDSICKHNFDLRLAGQHGHAFGKGIYFAKHATFADNYSRSSKDPLPLYGREARERARGVPGESTKIIFLARVMIGKSNLGQKHFQKPDHGIPFNSHDSCVDDTEHPKVFVIFDPNQIYPEYLIQYR